MKGLSTDEFQRLSGSIGIHRKGRLLSPGECGQLLDRAKRAGNYSLQDLAKSVHITDTGTIANFLRLLDVAPSYRHLVDWGQTGSTIAFTSAATLAKLDKSDQELCFVAAIAHKLKKTEVEQIVQIRQRSGRNVSECIDEVVGMRPKLTTVNVIIGAIAVQSVVDQLSPLLQSDKDEILVRAIESTFPNLQGYSARLGNDTFTITAGDDDANYLHSRAKTLEDIITERIQLLLQ